MSKKEDNTIQALESEVSNKYDDCYNAREIHIECQDELKTALKEYLNHIKEILLIELTSILEQNENARIESFKEAINEINEDIESDYHLWDSNIDVDEIMDDKDFTENAKDLTNRVISIMKQWGEIEDDEV